MARLTVLHGGKASGQKLGQPSRKLGQHGTALWKRINEAYKIEDAGGVEMLTQCCQAVDRAESMRAAIDEDGEVIKTKHGLKDHPLIRHELASRAFVVRTLTRMGLDVEPVRPGSRGRPPSMTHEDLERFKLEED